MKMSLRAKPKQSQKRRFLTSFGMTGEGPGMIELRGYFRTKRLLPVLFLFIFIYGIYVIYGCATPPPRPEEPEVFWPPPPDKPRIKYLKSYNNTFDVEDPPGFLQQIVGVEYYYLEAPQGVAADRDGNIYVADTTRNVIAVFQPEKKKLKFIGNREKDIARPRVPLGLSIAHKQNMLLVASAGTRSVIGYDLFTGDVRLVITEEFRNPAGVAVDEERGRIYVTDSKASELKVFDFSGRYISTIAKRGPEDYQLATPGQVATDRHGNIYVADIFNFKVKVFSPDGRFLKAIGKGTGDAPGYFAKLSGVAVDSDGNIYATDTAFNNFQIFNQEGEILLFIGGYSGDTPGAFNLPMHIYIDEKDRIYVADTFNSRVQVFQYLKEEGK